MSSSDSLAGQEEPKDSAGKSLADSLAGQGEQTRSTGESPVDLAIDFTEFQLDASSTFKPFESTDLYSYLNVT